MQINKKTYLAYRLIDDENMNNVCQKLNMDINELVKINMTKDAQGGDVILLAKRYIKSYVVKPLDTKEKIASILNISVEQLNKITNNKKLYIGQKIML